MGDDLKSCPFCGVSDTYMANGWLDGRYSEEAWFQVECQECCAAGPSKPCKYQATEEWNNAGAATARAKAAEQRAEAAEAVLAAARAELAQARAEGEAAGRAAERERVLALVRAAYDAAREVERRCEVLDPSAASGALDVLEQRIERGEHVGAAGGAA